MTDLSNRTPVPITAAQVGLPHDPNAFYIYRGCAIVGTPDGWDVLDASKPSPDADFAELGWGADMHEAMSVANFAVDGFERVRAH